MCEVHTNKGVVRLRGCAIIASIATARDTYIRPKMTPERMAEILRQHRKGKRR